MNVLYEGRAIVSGYIDGQKFRPSNWAERVSESGGTFHVDTKIFEYSQHLNAIRHREHGECLYVDFDALADEQPSVRNYVIWFIESNGLEVVFMDGALEQHAVVQLAS